MAPRDDPFPFPRGGPPGTIVRMRAAASALARRVLLLVASGLCVFGIVGCGGRALVGAAGREPDLFVSTTSASPTPGQVFTLTAAPPPGSHVDLSAVRWTTSDARIVELDSTAGPTVQAHARGAGQAVVTATVGGATGSAVIVVLASVGNVEITGPTTLDFGSEGTYSATVTDGTGRPIAGASVTWVANGSVQLSNPQQTVGTTVKIKAANIGPGAVSAMAGQRVGQIAVHVVVGAGGTLTVALTDGSPLPSMLAVGQVVTVEARFEGPNGVKAVATSAAWTGAGGCSVTSLDNGRAQVSAAGPGACSVMVSSMGTSGIATSEIVPITSVKIAGDASALALGGMVTLTAVAVSGATELPTVPVTWSEVGPTVVNVVVADNSVKVTGVAVGHASLVAMAGGSSVSAPCVVSPVTLSFAADSQRLLVGGATTVTVTPKGTGGVVGIFATASGVALAGAQGFSSVGSAVLTPSGLVTFALTNAIAASPRVTATFGAITSNALAFALTTVGSVSVVGPNGPVRIGSTVDLSLDVRDAQGMAVAGGVSATWSDASGVLVLPPTSDGFAVTATVARLGLSMLIATVRGVSSAPYSNPGVPSMIGVTPFFPASVSLGGTATTTVTVLDVAGNPVPGVSPAQISVTTSDDAKVTLGAPVVVGEGFQVIATGVAPTAAAGASVTATWTAGTESVMSAAVQLVVTAP
jgi:hypothetical protein